MEEKQFTSRQIFVRKTDKKLIEAVDRLKPSEEESYAKLHGKYSKIKMQILDYSGGTASDGKKARSAAHNLDVADVKLLAERISREITRLAIADLIPPALLFSKLDNQLKSMNWLASKATEGIVALPEKSIDRVTKPHVISEFSYAEEKLIGSVKDDEGRSPMTKFTINRYGFDKNGDPRKMPWFIQITEGTAIAETRSNGGISAKKGSFKQIDSLNVALTDDEITEMFTKICDYIRVWECCVAGSVVKVGWKKAEAEEAEARRNKG